MTPLEGMERESLEALVVELESLLVNLVKAREAKSKANMERQRLAEKHGLCEGNETNPEEGLNPTAHCYMIFKTDHSLWCETCLAKLPAWEAYRKASIEAGSALRRVLYKGKRLCSP